MKVLKREEAIKLLQRGETMIETQWGGYSYSIDMYTVRFETARYLIINKLVEEDKSRGAPLLKYFKWAQYKKDSPRGIRDENNQRINLTKNAQGSL